MLKTRLWFAGVSEIVGSDDLGMLVLVDEQRGRQLTVICEKSMAVQLEMRIKRLPITSLLLPEVLCNVLKNQAGLHFEILINDLIDGQYKAILYNLMTLEPVPIRVSDAVLLNVAGHIPLYIESGLMDRQSVPYQANAKGVPIPVNTLNEDMLVSALEKAIQEENYELASQLRDEQQKRKKTGTTDS